MSVGTVVAQPANKAAYDAFAIGLTRVVAALAAWMVVGLHIFRPSSQILGYKFVFFLSLACIVWGARMRGPKVFAKTPLDLVFVTWLGLAVLSQLYASMALSRILSMNDLYSYLSMILTTWAVFRGAFALTIVDPKTSSGAFIKAILFFLGVACLIGILQGFGPSAIRDTAMDFAQATGAKGESTDLSMELSSPRPIAVFSGPNYFGFMNLIAMCVVIGLTVIQGKTMSSRSVWMATGGLFVFLFGTLAAQSRFAIATAFLLLLVFLYWMLRTGRRRVFASGVVAIGAMVIGGLALLPQMDLRYLEGTFEKKLADDSSLKSRERSWKNLEDQAPQLAILGGGWDSEGYNNTRMVGDMWSRTNSIDNGYLQSFINHGLPGVLHLLYLFGACAWALRLAKPYPHTHIRALRAIGFLLLITYMVYSVSGVRHAKLETSVYWMIIFGSLYGAVYGERWFGHLRPIKFEKKPITASA